VTRVPMKCRVCRGPAVIDLKRHNANFCREHFVAYCEEQVRRAIHHFRMLEPGERVLVAVSGGKDSLACWDLLVRLGYAVEGFYLGLGIDTYSDDSLAAATRFADARGLTLHVVDLETTHGFTIPVAAGATHRSPCGACGLSKRHEFNRVARDLGFGVLATGHNLDDEAAVLLGNVLRWETDYLARQHPCLPAEGGFVRKIKPLYRLGEREMAAYCILEGIDYQVDECPMAAGNRHIGFKETLNDLERRSPGSKAAFLFGFLDRMAPLLAQADGPGDAEVHACAGCGEPTTGDVCAFCRLRDKARA